MSLLKKNRAFRATGCGGFTLLEMITVVAIMGLLMGITVAAYYGMGKGIRERGAVSNMLSTLALARQYAITRFTKVTVVFEDPSEGQHYYYVTNNLSTNGMAIKPPQYLPPAIKFDGLDVDEITFTPTGTLDTDGGASPQLSLKDESGAEFVTITINRFTGLAKAPDDI